MKNYYPIKNSKGIAHIRKVENGSYVLSEYSISNTEVFLNSTSSFILELCTGENSIYEIILNIKKEFHEDDEEMIREDVEHVLHEMWCRGYVVWKDKNNPFIKYYEQKKGKYTYCLGNIDLLEKYEKRMGGIVYTDLHYNEKVILGKDFLYSTYLNGVNTVFALKEGDNELLRLFVNIDVPGRRVYVRHMELLIDNEDICEIYRDFIEWSCKELIKRNCIESKREHICNCIMVIDSKDTNNSYLEKIGFQLKGKLANEVYMDEQYKDAAVFVKKICY